MLDIYVLDFGAKIRIAEMNEMALHYAEPEIEHLQQFPRT